MKGVTTEIKSMVELMKEACIRNINTMAKRGTISIEDENMPKLKGIIDSTIDDCFSRAYNNIEKAVKKQSEK